MILAPEGLAELDQNQVPDAWKTRLSCQAGDVAAFDWSRFVDTLSPSKSTSCSVLVDCTSNESAVDLYEAAIQRGCHVVTPNKKFGSGALDRYRRVLDIAKTSGRNFMYEATVGAGLPLISTLKSLIETGDSILKVEGILSGTLSFIFNTFDPKVNSFSAVVVAAKEKGYTEPDPRDDLGGVDVARKVCILARTLGLPLDSLNDINSRSLVPEPLSGVSIDEFMTRLPEFDAEIATQATAAAEKGEKMLFVGVVDVSTGLEKGIAKVELANYPSSHPFAQLSGADNIVCITTLRYGGPLGGTPLVIRGPGAGAEVTAAGVFSDIIQAVRTHPRSV
nr:bifunctional aspartokinase/homoserine dehydrogenase 1, chloroplastic-like (AK) [Polytomella parva]